MTARYELINKIHKTKPDYLHVASEEHNLALSKFMKKLKIDLKPAQRKDWKRKEVEEILLESQATRVYSKNQSKTQTPNRTPEKNKLVNGESLEYYAVSQSSDKRKSTLQKPINNHHFVMTKSFNINRNHPKISRLIKAINKFKNTMPERTVYEYEFIDDDDNSCMKKQEAKSGTNKSRNRSDKGQHNYHSLNTLNSQNKSKIDNQNSNLNMASQVNDILKEDLIFQNTLRKPHDLNMSKVEFEILNMIDFEKPVATKLPVLDNKAYVTKDYVCSLNDCIFNVQRMFKRSQIKRRLMDNFGISSNNNESQSIINEYKAEDSNQDESMSVQLSKPTKDRQYNFTKMVNLEKKIRKGALRGIFNILVQYQLNSISKEFIQRLGQSLMKKDLIEPIATGLYETATFLRAIDLSCLMEDIIMTKRLKIFRYLKSLLNQKRKDDEQIKFASEIYKIAHLNMLDTISKLSEIPPDQIIRSFGANPK